MVLQRAAAAGHGMIRTACYMADTDPALMRLPGAEPENHRDLWVLTHSNSNQTPRIRRPMDHLITALQDKRDLVIGQIPLVEAERDQGESNAMSIETRHSPD